eukprot:TRINITY_DN557_c0_g1_i1.p1 TRINITY_DN557_c0_g1~~TRINITY_DN557_c0_g1_i1.p1  ORF type:complete len:204 (+),score=41.96 TRINITY_DN557_c0_g1_i1:61-612(+)
MAGLLPLAPAPVSGPPLLQETAHHLPWTFVKFAETVPKSITHNSSFSRGICRASRRELTSMGLVSAMVVGMPFVAKAGLEEEYAKDTTDVIAQVRSTMEMNKSDPGAGKAVADLRESSNNWVAKYRREKKLAGKPSFSNMYSVLNAISGHYISFGPTTPIPSKRKARILEEVDIAEKALSKGR